MIEIAETFVYPNQDTLLIKRPEKFGGDIELTKENPKTYTLSGLETIPSPKEIKQILK